MYQLNPQNVKDAFDGQERMIGKNKATFYTQPVDKIVITSGTIATCDPFVDTNPEPYTFQFPTGEFPVELAIAKFESDDERVVYARIVFSDQAAATYEMAALEGQDLASLTEREYFGYGVDAGTGCFMDASIASIYDEKMAENEALYDDLFDEMDKSYQHTRSWLSFKPSDDRPENIICFSSGWGDGMYPSFIGKDAKGDVVSLVTDFFVVL